MFEQLYVFWLLVCLAGGVAGFLAGLFGIGGGIVVVPALYTLFLFQGISESSAMAMAVSTSLMTIVPTSASSIRAHHLMANVDWKSAVKWLPSLITGAVIGAFGVSRVNVEWLRILFAAVALFVAAMVFFRLIGAVERKQVSLNSTSWLGCLRQQCLMFCIALLSALVGVGGGALGGPLLLSMGFAAHRAIGTAATFGFVISLPATLWIMLTVQTPVDALPGSYGLVNVPAFGAVVTGSIFTAPLGAKFGKTLSSNQLGAALVIILLLIVIRMVLGSV